MRYFYYQAGPSAAVFLYFNVSDGDSLMPFARVPRPQINPVPLNGAWTGYAG